MAEMRAQVRGALLAALRGGAALLPPGPRVLPPEQVAGVHRARLIAGMAEAAAEKGYAATTIADVVARAQVSRRTFYEHFADKEACFLATFDAVSDLTMAVIAQAVGDDERPWEDRVAAGVEAYLQTLAGEPGLTRVFVSEILGAGPEALRRRRAVHRRFADLLQELARAHAADLPEGAGIDEDMALAVVGGVDELVRLAVEEDRLDDLPRFARIAQRLVLAALMPA
jgi:AcrR family transcriptional regulator